MSGAGRRCPFASRRRFLGAAGGLAGALGATLAYPRIGSTTVPSPGAPAATTEPFFGPHQGGILTRMQGHTYFAAFDLVADTPSAIAKMLQDWTAATARMTTGETAAPPISDQSLPASDTGVALGLPPARLTLTFGFGAGLFVKDGKDRYGLAARRPDALLEMPRFNGDQLVEARSGGDISVQACADDPQVAFHAIRELVRLANGVAQIRWAQTGFSADFAPEETPRNLMGFKDGTENPISRQLAEGHVPSASDIPHPQELLWVGSEGPDWMRGGTYLVVRRIRIALEHWDASDVDFQEQVIGRHKLSGAPLGAKSEFDPLDLAATDSDGNPVIPEDAHVRLAAAASNDGARILRRAYSYNDGVNFTAERWPPWRQGIEYDAGLLFVCYQRDPRTGFIKIFEPMSKLDALNQFTTHTASGLFACPAGIENGEFIGQRLFA